MWSCDRNYAEQVMALDDSEFAGAVAEAMSHRLGDVTLLSPRGAFELKQIHAQRYISERIALIGDAAHRTHPLAGLGANIGFVDAAALAETVSNAHQAGRDIGSLHTLRKYERWRRGQNARILNTMQGFKSLFGSESPALVSARRLGLALTNRAQPIKTMLTSHAIGLSGDLPQACRMSPE